MNYMLLFSFDRRKKARAIRAFIYLALGAFSRSGIV